MDTSTIAREQQTVQEAAKEKFGFIPNFIKEISQAPAAAQVYLKGTEIMGSASLSQDEQEVVKFAISRENSCEYCLAAHSKALQQAGFDKAELETLRNGGPFSNNRYQSLAELAQLLIEKRGWLESSDINRFNQAGISQPQVYEVIALVGLKTISNYVNHIAHTDLDPQLQG